MKKNYLLFVLLCSSFGYSQFNSNAPWMKSNSSESGKQLEQRERTIGEIKASFDAYWLAHDKDKKGSGYKPFMRWENHWKSKTDDKGYLITPQEMWAAWAQKNKQAQIQKKTQTVPSSNWVPLGPFTYAVSSGQGRVGVVYVDPSNSSTIYIGAPAGGIWKSTDTGLNWKPLADNLPQIGVSGIAVDHFNSNIIYIATGDKDAADTYSVGVLKSIDGGVTWNTTGLAFSNSSTLAGDLIVSPTNGQILWCATNVGLYKTSDGGVTWKRILEGNFAQGSIRLKPKSPNTVYAVSNNKFYRSINAGDSFSEVTTGLPTASKRLLLDVTPANAEYVYILSAATTTGFPFQGIYKSSNGGTSFVKTSNQTDIFESDQAWYDLALAASSTNAEEIYTGCLNIWKSMDGGVTVTKVNDWRAESSAAFTHADIHFLGFYGNKLYTGTDGGIYSSSNGGVKFSNLTAGLQISQFYRIAVSKLSAEKITGGLQDNGGHAYNNNEWKKFHGGDGMDAAIDPNNSYNCYGFVQNGSTLYISNNGGSSISGAAEIPTGEKGNWVTPLAINKAGELFSGFSKIYKLTGTSWVQNSSAALGTGEIEYIAIDPSNDNNMFASNEKVLYKSTDKGVTFSTSFSFNGVISSICVHSADSNTIYVTTEGFGFNGYGRVYKSTDGGSSFIDITEGLPSVSKNVIRHQDRNNLNPLYLGTSLGVYYRDDSMVQWEPFDTNLPNVSVSDLEITYEDAKITAATYGRGVWQADIPVEPLQNDLKLVSIEYPTLEVNYGSIVPKITLKNKGLSPISTVTVDYSYNGTPQNFVWNGNIAPAAIISIDLPNITAPKGAYPLTIKVSITNDSFLDNNSSTSTFYVNDFGTTGVVNGFENDSSTLLTYTDGSTTSLWKNGVRTGDALATGRNKVYTTTLKGNYPDKTKAYLISQCYNLSNVSSPSIRFKMAYELEQDWDVVYVEFSTNFGKKWSVLGTVSANWYNSNRTPRTSGDDCYNCPGAQWTGADLTLKEYSYPLNELAGQTNVIFRIVFHSDEAENMLGVVVDDFVIDGTLATQQFEMNNVTVYPNPSKGVFNVSMGNVDLKTIEVYDLSGRIIYSKKDFQNSSKEISVDLSHMSNGIYFVKIASDEQTIAKRIIKN